MGGLTPFGPSGGTTATIQGLGQTSAAQRIKKVYSHNLLHKHPGTGTCSSLTHCRFCGSSEILLYQDYGATVNPITTAPTGIGSFIDKLMPKTTAGKIAAASFALPLLTADDGPNKMYLPIPNQNYTKYANYGFGATPTGFQTRDYATGIDSPLVQPGDFRTPEEVLGDEPTQSFKAVEMNTGGLASIAKFNEGGMGQVLPSLPLIPFTL
jgi:hypothetical protein